MIYDKFTDLILENVGSYKPKKLPYALNDLEPYIDKETMNLHYNKHYKGYLKKLNDVTTSNKPLPSLLKSNLNNIKIRNNGGGVLNHELFWKMMTPNSRFKGQIKELIDNKYGSLNKFKEEFVESSLNNFGSGWCWLTLQSNNRLKIENTQNQDNPLMFKDTTILLGIDLWEHAYYKKYGPNREQYVKKWFNVINWDYCNIILADR